MVTIGVGREGSGALAPSGFSYVILIKQRES